ncbi:MAG: YceI family protein [Gemmatimonadota bacterium]|nr:YceI family protein [Gemmatimonadota bacterium]MDH5282920.1 YceI family protein [Gemmatimonadota bacterium]
MTFAFTTPRVRLTIRMGPLPLVMFLVAGAGAAPMAAQSAVGLGGTYRLLSLSRLEVKTGKAGLFGFAGHEHLIRASAFDGEVLCVPGRPGATVIRIRIPTDSLQVLTPPHTQEIRKVTASMRDDVMQVVQYPEIVFVSKSVAQDGGHYQVTADLTMHGQTRTVKVLVDAAFTGDTLKARSSFTVRQSDSGIRPYRGGPAGSVRVADEVEFPIEAVAVRQQD